MKGIFVRELPGGIPYASAIVHGHKPIETRSRRMLSGCVGDRVAVIRTGRGSPVVVGYVKIVRESFCPADRFESFRDLTLIPPGSKFDCRGRGKWFYWLSRPEWCKPYPLPAGAIRHGRSWAEWEVIA